MNRNSPFSRPGTQFAAGWPHNSITVCVVVATMAGGLSIKAIAQQDTIKREVEVVKPYQPVISDAFKISDLPQVIPQGQEKPAFDYSVRQKPVVSFSGVDPIQAARIDREKIQQGTGLLRAGAGSYYFPYGELFLNTAANERTSFGLHLYHLSSQGKIKLENDDRVKAPSSDSRGTFYFNYFFDRANLQSKVFYDRQAFRYYGYQGERLTLAQKQELIPYWDRKQAFPKIGFEIQLDGTPVSQSSLRWEGVAGYRGLRAKTGQDADYVNFSGQIEQDFEFFRGRLRAGIAHSGTDSLLIGENYRTRKQTLFELSPSILFESDVASLRLGINGFSVFDPDKDTDWLLTPNIQASWSVLPNSLALYAGADGRIQHNHYAAIAEENRYANPEKEVENAKYRYVLTGGVRGRIVRELSYKLEAGYTSVENQHFYVLTNQGQVTGPDAVDIHTIGNTFDAIYDNVKQASVEGEVMYAPSDLFNIYLKGTWYDYDLKIQENAWHQPKFAAAASAGFSPVEPFRFTADVTITGPRKAVVIDQLTIPAGFAETQTILKLPAFADISLGAEYRYSLQLTFWGRVNNFAMQRYDQWLGYANKGLNILAGVSFSF